MTARWRWPRCATRKYGLVISDWNMEPMTGYDLLQEVRNDPGLAQTPFIMVTAESKTENVIAAKKAGVSNYIVKPFNAQTLKSKIDAVFPDAKPEPTMPHAAARPDLTTPIAASPPSAFRRRRRSVALSAAGSGRLAPAQFLGMDAGGHEQEIDAERRARL